jgi:hypothetical protein
MFHRHVLAATPFLEGSAGVVSVAVADRHPAQIAHSLVLAVTSHARRFKKILCRPPV